MSYTPGPWLLEFSEGAGYDSMTDAWMIYGARRERIITDVDLGSYGQSARTAISAEGRAVAEANARLIAAAPDLLEALKLLRDGSYGNPRYPAETRRIDAMADAAIAKAEGR